MKYHTYKIVYNVYLDYLPHNRLRLAMKSWNDNYKDNTLKISSFESEKKETFEVLMRHTQIWKLY